MSKRTFQKGVHTIHLPSSSGITLNAHMSGRLRIRGDLERAAGKEMFPLPDDVCIIPPGLGRTLIVAPKGDEPATMASLTVSLDALHRFIGQEDLQLRVARLRDWYPAVRFDPVLAAVVKAVAAASEVGADDLYVQSAAQFIAAHVLSPPTAGSARSTGALSSRQLETVLTYMRENLGQPVSVDDLASLVSFSRFHFVRCFKATTGSTPYRYLTDLRIDLARKYLESGNDPIARIGQCCGFSGSEHFSRSFRRIMGCTPSQYRAMRA
ncbi:AraC family transcriptional regulator [Streptomyces olivochromogenes]|uniref:AraC family transcriptional regulator n=1 Tax=Streptomyces olivochromogenes TaxID=1963 RepID=UPI001F2B6AF8|nr:AraC family transcriptional regulator [Streptomyces olivochromogenes]MCF3129227.1 AraC family transcriptional regulator [Streptomyces olivochromogenes]